jgi:hypothetical protein
MKVKAIPRREKRVPMAIAVQLGGHADMPGIETTFTENVSSHGARVYSVRPWRKDDRLWLSSLPGGFQSEARVAYCERQQVAGFAIGLEFLDPKGDWVVGPGPSDGLHPA